MPSFWLNAVVRTQCLLYSNIYIYILIADTQKTDRQTDKVITITLLCKINNHLDQIWLSVLLHSRITFFCDKETYEFHDKRVWKSSLIQPIMLWFYIHVYTCCSYNKTIVKCKIHVVHPLCECYLRLTPRLIFLIYIPRLTLPVTVQ